MRQRRQVDHQRIARNVLAEEHRDGHLADLELRLLHHLAQSDDLPLLVGHFDPDRVLAGDGGHDPHGRHAQGNRQIVGQAGDLRQP